MFLLIARKVEHFEGRSSPSSWIDGICRNVARGRAAAPIAPAREVAGELPEVPLSAAQPQALKRMAEMTPADADPILTHN